MTRLASDGSKNHWRMTMDITDEKFGKIWWQSDMPVISRQGQYLPVLVRLPHSDTNSTWIRGGKKNKPQWNPQLECWETPRAWFNEMIQLSLKRYGAVYIVQRYRQMQKCVPACWNAQGFDCECSCMGDNHGSGHPGGRWYVVSDKFAFKWGSSEYACRRIKASDQAQPVQGNASAPTEGR